MRVLLLAVLVLLSGCASSSIGLGGYMLQAGEAPESCRLLAYDSPDGQMIKEMYNWTGNPGRVDNEVFEEDGIVPVDNMIGLWECGEHEVASVALRFANATQAQTYAGSEPMCDDDIDYGEVGVILGAVVAFVEGDEDIPGMTASLETWRDRVHRMSGTPNPCHVTVEQ